MPSAYLNDEKFHQPIQIMRDTKLAYLDLKKKFSTYSTDEKMCFTYVIGGGTSSTHLNDEKVS